MKHYLTAAAILIGSTGGAAHAISDEGWFCPPGTELYQGQCWAPTQPQESGGDATATATGGKAVSGSHSASKALSGSTSGAQVNNAVNIRNKQSAASAIAPQLNGYGVPNCFGDINPSGSFTAGMQTFGWGVSAGSSKASNVCAIAQLAGPEAALQYLQKMDRNVPRNIIIQQRTRVSCPASHPVYVEGKGCRK